MEDTMRKIKKKRGKAQNEKCCCMWKNERQNRIWLKKENTTPYSLHFIA